jgi:hypothetical protein
MCIIMYKCVCLREKSGSSSVSNTLVINHGPQQALSTLPLLMRSIAVDKIMTGPIWVIVTRETSAREKP